MGKAGLPLDERKMIVDLLMKVRQRMMTPEVLRRIDKLEEFPENIIRELLGPNIGLQLLFIPEEFGGMGGGARDIAVISEEMAKVCLGIATAFLAIHLGTDPILVGATAEQKQKWLTKIAEEGCIVAYAVTEPEAGSNLSNFKTKAEPVTDATGAIMGYRINGNKQFISNGGFADFLTVLAQAPEGPTFFIVEKNAEGFKPGKAEEKHGIRCSNTAPLTFNNVFVPADQLVGGVPGQGLNQANEVFGYTRLMVAAFGLGAGVAALERVVSYARERIQFGSPLIEKQGFTHKLIIPHYIHLEAARAYIEEVADRLDSGEKDLQIEGSIAKLFATESGNACAESAIQALGGYGYIHEYDVEKIKRDVKITTIYEGTSEIQQMIISTFRWRASVKSKWQFYQSMADEMAAVPDDSLHAGLVSQAADVLNKTIQFVHLQKLTRLQFIMFKLADCMTEVETAVALIRKTVSARNHGSQDFQRLQLISRLFAREVLLHCQSTAHLVKFGSSSEIPSPDTIHPPNDACVYRGMLDDMDSLLRYL